MAIEQLTDILSNPITYEALGMGLGLGTIVGTVAYSGLRFMESLDLYEETDPADEKMMRYMGASLGILTLIVTSIGIYNKETSTQNNSEQQVKLIDNNILSSKLEKKSTMDYLKEKGINVTFPNRLSYDLV